MWGNILTHIGVHHTRSTTVAAVAPSLVSAYLPSRRPMTVTTGIIATAAIVARWRDDAAPIPTSDYSDRRDHRRGRDRCLVAGGRRSSSLGGRDRQREEGVQKSPSSGADDEEREEESGGANTMEEKEHSNGGSNRSRRCPRRSRYRPRAARWALTRSPSMRGVGRREQRALVGTRRRSEGSGHHCPTPAGTIPPLVDDEGVEGRESRE